MFVSHFSFCFEKFDWSDNITMLEQLPDCDTMITCYRKVVARKAVGVSALKNVVLSFQMFATLQTVPFSFFILS